MNLVQTVLFCTVVFFLCYSAMCNVGKLNSDLKPISKKYSGMKQLFFILRINVFLESGISRADKEAKKKNAFVGYNKKLRATDMEKNYYKRT